MIGVAADDDGNSGSYITFGDGNQASIAFSNDSSLALRYFAVTGDPTVAASTDKVFRRNNQYAFFNYNQNSYLATLRDYVDSINTTALLAGVRDLPTPFNGSNASTLQKYKDFFQRFGSHIVTKVRYGARLQLVSELLAVPHPSGCLNLTYRTSGRPMKTLALTITGPLMSTPNLVEFLPVVDTIPLFKAKHNTKSSVSSCKSS